MQRSPGFAEFLCPSAGVNLVGVIYLGGGEGPRPTCVLLHGFPGSEKNLDIAYALREAGSKAVVWSPRGCWGSRGDFTIAGMRDDLAALLAFLRQSPWPIDWERLALLGYSLGAATVIQFAHAHPALAAALALLAPVSDFLELSLATEYAATASEFVMGATATALQKEWMQQAWAGNPIDLITELTAPVLVVQGDADETAPLDVTRALVEAASSRCEFVVLPGADHLFNAHRRALVAEVVGWLQAQLGP